MTRYLNACIAAATCLLTVACSPPVVRHGAMGGWTEEPVQIASGLNDGGNGIYVQDPKAYDDASLRALLDGIKQKLQPLTGLSQDALTSHIGAVSGATIDQRQFGVSVGTALPSIQTNAQSGTSSTTTDSSGTSSLTVTTPTLGTMTSSPTVPTAPTVPSTLAFTPSSTVQPNSLDVLNEQMQLSFQIANLELLLEGSLTDFFVKDQNFTKQRVTLGFPISVRPRVEYKDAVAVVEIEAATGAQGFSDESPAVVTLLPREQTYNVAAMTDHSTSIGGGAILGAISLGGSFLSGHKTLYLVKDQDTVSTLLPPLSDKEPGFKKTVRFAWEFHPVLGESYVRGGPRQTFVQLAFPMSGHSDKTFGDVSMRTYWRKFDKDTGVVGDIIPGSVFRLNQSSSVVNYKLQPIIDHATAEDLADGTLRVSIQGTFRDGTYVELGPNRFDAGKGLIVEDAGLTFVAPASAFAQWDARVVSRNGTFKELLVDLPDRPSPAPPAPAAPTCSNPRAIEFKTLPTFETFDESKSIVRFEIKTVCRSPLGLPSDLLMAVGGKVFGLKDAPIIRDNQGQSMAVTAVVPTELVSSRTANVTVFAPLFSDVEGDKHFSWSQEGRRKEENRYYVSAPVAPAFGLDSEVERLVLVSVGTDGAATFMLYGNGLDGAMVISPAAGAKLEPIAGVAGKQTRTLTLTKAAVAEAKKLVLLKHGAARPSVIDVPKIPSDKTADKKAADDTTPKISLDTPLVQNTQEADASVDDAADLVSVKLQDKELHWKPTDKSAIHFVSLKDDGVTAEQKTVSLVFTYKNKDKVTVGVDVVAARFFVKQPPAEKKS